MYKSHVDVNENISNFADQKANLKVLHFNGQQKHSTKHICVGYHFVFLHLQGSQVMMNPMDSHSLTRLNKSCHTWTCYLEIHAWTAQRQLRGAAEELQAARYTMHENIASGTVSQKLRKIT